MNNAQGRTDLDFKITGNWDTQAQLLKEKYPQLTKEDLKFETGKEIELLGRVEQRLNKRRVEVMNIIRKGLPGNIH